MGAQEIVVVGTLLAGAMLVGCGDDDEVANRPSRAEFATGMIADCDASDAATGPIFAEIFADGEATLEEWAAAIPRYLPVLEADRERRAVLSPPVGTDQLWGDFMSATEAFVALQHDALAAAEAGDQEAFDVAEAEAQGPVKERLINGASELGFAECFD